MKRSKLFLAATGAILAIVGVVSAKTHRIAKINGYFTSTRNLCTQISVTKGVTVNSSTTSNVVHTILSRGTYTVYSVKNATSKCGGNKLYTQGL